MRRERLWGGARHLNSRLFPPAPLTGDVGRGCGDASRALLFFCRYQNTAMIDSQLEAFALSVGVAVRQVVIRKCALPRIMAQRAGRRALLVRSRAEEHRMAVDANEPLVLATLHLRVVREHKIDGIRPVVLTSLGARPEVVTAAKILLLEDGMAFAAEEEARFVNRGFAPITGKIEIEALRLVIAGAVVAGTDAQAHARRAVVELHIAALDTEMPIGLMLGHANTFAGKLLGINMDP